MTTAENSISRHFVAMRILLQAKLVGRKVLCGRALTASSLIHAIQADDLALLRQAHQREDDIELVPPQRDIAACGSHQGHDAGLSISAEPSSGKEFRDAASRDPTAGAVLAQGDVERLDVAVGYLGRGEQVADQVGAALLLPRRGHVPGRAGVAISGVIGEEAVG